jgi:hypothetical protein
MPSETYAEEQWRKITDRGSQTASHIAQPVQVFAGTAAMQRVSQSVRRHRRQAGATDRVRPIAKESKALHPLM